MDSLITDVMDIKTYNVKKIVDIIRFDDTYTKKDVAIETNLSMATVYNLCSELYKKNVLIETKITEQRVGRTPSIISFNYQNFHVLTVDLQIENMLSIALLNLRNEVLVWDDIDISGEHEINDIVNKIYSTYKLLSKRVFIDANLIGVGVSVPAIFDKNDDKLKSSALEIFENQPLKKLLTDVFDCKVYINNCANLRALSEYTENSSCKNIVCIDISQGVGAGVICEGNIVEGKNGYATELAHIPIGSDQICPLCGNIGCVETDLGISYIVNKFLKETNIDSTLNLPEKWNLCTEYLFNNKKKYKEYLDFLGQILGKLSSILINMFDPEKFYITGYFTSLIPLIYDSFTSELNRRIFLFQQEKIKIGIKQPKTFEIHEVICNTMYNLWNPLNMTEH
ncbi:MAG TPA: ROK family protein [Clostridiaceae bacterium]|nr:ROK family protein [Clostridiaceae bacterium]